MDGVQGTTGAARRSCARQAHVAHDADSRPPGTSASVAACQTFIECGQELLVVGDVRQGSAAVSSYFFRVQYGGEVTTK